MNKSQRDHIELGDDVPKALAGENCRGMAVAVKVIARRAQLAERGGKAAPAGTRPKLLRTASLLGALCAVALAGCIQPPAVDDTVHNEDVHIGPAIVALECRTPDGYPFTYTGLAEGAPYEWCGLPPLLQRVSK